MPPTPPSTPVPRRVWPARWAAALRDRLQLLRLLTLILALLGFFGALAAFGFASRSPFGEAGTAAAMVALSVLWIHGYRREGLSVRWLPLETILLAAYTFGVNPVFRPFGAIFLALQHRALYGTRRDATLAAFAYGLVFVAAKATRGSDLLGSPMAIVLQVAVGAFGAYVMHTLAEVLARDEDRARRVRASEERYRAMFDRNPWPMWLFEPGTVRIVEVNDAAVRQYGYSRKEFLGMTLYDIRPESERAELRAISAAVKGDERTSYLVRHRRKGGEVFEVEVTSHPVEFDGRSLRLAVAVDVSARERVERELRDSEARFRSVANCLREALLITDRNDRIILANDAVRTVLGHEPAAVIGRVATDLLLPAAHRNVFDDRLRQRLDGASELYEVDLVRADGTVITAEVSASPYRDTSGAIVGTLGAISDITARKQLEARVRQSSRLEAVGQLAGGVAHDFNNLLTVIKCHAELLRDDVARNEAAQASVREIEQAADRAADVTGQLLAFSRKQLMQPRRVELDRVVTETLPGLRKLCGPRIEIATSSDGSMPTAFADPTQLETVLVTLVRNACDAMPRGGRILIGTETRDVEAQDLSLQNQRLPDGTFTVLTVTDTGSGMDGTIMDRLFEPFFTTKPAGAGTGMGLAGLFGIIRQSGGFVDVRSVPAQGTSFTIYLPAASDRARADAAAALSSA